MDKIPTLLCILSIVSGAAFADVTIPYAVPHDGRVSLALYDQDNRMVRTLLTGTPRQTGHHVETWDGRDRYGNPLPAGPYTWKMES